jgi:hypothetical protein
MSVLFCAAAQAVPVQVSQESAAGAGDFDANVLGVIDVYATPLSTADFYAYSPLSFSSHSPISYVSERTHVFFIDSAVDGLSLAIVHDKVNNGSNGSAHVNLSIVGDPDSATVRVGDEPYEVTPLGPNDFDLDHIWGGCCTDGAAVGNLNGPWAAFVDFLGVPNGIDSWFALSSTGGDVGLSLSVGRRARFQPIPEPASATLLAALGAMLVLLTRMPACLPGGRRQDPPRPMCLEKGASGRSVPADQQPVPDRGGIQMAISIGMEAMRVRTGLRGRWVIAGFMAVSTMLAGIAADTCRASTTAPAAAVPGAGGATADCRASAAGRTHGAGADGNDGRGRGIPPVPPPPACPHGLTSPNRAITPGPGTSVPGLFRSCSPLSHSRSRRCASRRVSSISAACVPITPGSSSPSPSGG